MSYFCGNPRNHEPHNAALSYCDGVQINKPDDEEVVETFKPNPVEAKSFNGFEAVCLPVAKVTIHIETEDDEIEIYIEQTELPQLEVFYEQYTAYRKETVKLGSPNIEEMTLSMKPIPGAQITRTVRKKDVN